MYRSYYSPAEWKKIIGFSEKKETPFLVILLDRVQKKFEEFRKNFPQAKIYYAVKASPGTEILTLLKDLGSYFDIASIYELDQVLGLGISPDQVSFGNTIKKAKHIHGAYGKGVRLFASDSEADIVKSYAKGACSYITKPMDFDKFRDVVKQFAIYWVLVARVPSRQG